MHSILKKQTGLFGWLLFLLLLSSCTVNKIHDGAFNYHTTVENELDKGDFVENMDGAKTYGKIGEVNTAILKKRGVIMDGKQYKFGDVKSFRSGGVFWAKMPNGTFVQRIVHGKINVYVDRFTVTTTGTAGTTTQVHAGHYAQVGDDGKFVFMNNQSDMKKILASCPAAVAIVDVSGSEIRKGVRQNPSYLNNAFETYNNDCNVVTTNPKKGF